MIGSIIRVSLFEYFREVLEKGFLLRFKFLWTNVFI